MSKTVTTYLIDGDPKETLYSFIRNKICQMFVISLKNNNKKTHYLLQGIFYKTFIKTTNLISRHLKAT